MAPTRAGGGHSFRAQRYRHGHDQGLRRISTRATPPMDLHGPHPVVGACSPRMRRGTHTDAMVPTPLATSPAVLDNLSECWGCSSTPGNPGPRPGDFPRSPLPSALVPAGAGDDSVEFHQPFAVGQFAQLRRQFGEFLAIFAGGRFVKHLAQAVEVGLRRARAFRRGEAFGAHVRARRVHARHQPMSASLGTPLTKMMFDGFTSRWTRPLPCRCSSAVAARGRCGRIPRTAAGRGREIALERARGVVVRVDLAAGGLVVGQFHHVIEAVVAAADVEDVHLAVVPAGDRFELEDALELALERPVVIEGLAVDDLDRAEAPVTLRASQTSGSEWVRKGGSRCILVF